LFFVWQRTIEHPKTLQIWDQTTIRQTTTHIGQPRKKLFSRSAARIENGPKTAPEAPRRNETLEPTLAIGAMTTENELAESRKAA